MIAVERPGPRTVVQDLGRPGYAHLGVPLSGAADRFSSRLANRLVANPDDAAVLETTLVGPTLRFETDAVVAVTGAPAPVLIDEAKAPFGTALRLRGGQRLRIGAASEGVRTYLAVAGGVDVAAVLGSRSADTLSGLGPKPLARGDQLTLGAATAQSLACVGRSAPARLLASVLPDGRRRVRVVPAPASEWFAAEAHEVLWRDEFVVTPASDRVGVRLAGGRIPVTATEAPTQGIVTGAIQVPPDGSPIVLLADHAVTGGYPVIGVVVTVDVPTVAQARPGVHLRFTATTLSRARAAYVEQERRLAAAT